jgi:hypothetical protein
MCPPVPAIPSDAFLAMLYAPGRYKQLLRQGNAAARSMTNQTSTPEWATWVPRPACLTWAVKRARRLSAA